MFDLRFDFPCWSYMCSNKGMVQVLPAAGFRPTDNRPGTAGWPALSGPRTVARTDGGIIRHDCPDRQSLAGAGRRAGQGHGRGTGSAGPLAARRPAGLPDGPGRAAIATRVCPPGTGHTPEEEL